MLPLWVSLWGALVAPTVPALRQAPDSEVIRRYGIAVISTADTLDMLRGFTQAFLNDRQTASPNLILDRANSVENACASSIAMVRQLQGMLAARSVSAEAAKSQAKFRAAAEELVAALQRCTRSWLPLPRTDSRSDTLRAWGPYRVNEITQALRKFDFARFAFAKAAGLPAQPARKK